VNSDEVLADYPPDHLAGVPFADADVTDESFDERTAQEEPEQLPAEAKVAERVRGVEPFGSDPRSMSRTSRPGGSS
jgi:hypothetical protein